MKNLGNTEDCQQVLDRLARVRPDSPRRWGRMTAHGMICHLSDSYLLPLGERTASPATGLFQRTIMKWVALNSPLPWPKGISTRPEMEQGVGGTPPANFERDLAGLVSQIRRFAAPRAAFPNSFHPIFGTMSRQHWLRWGYLHADHHLRQFNA